MLQKTLNFFVKSFLLLLPFQTVWIYDEIFLNGVKSQWGVSSFYLTEILLCGSIFLFIIWLFRQGKIKNQKSKIKITRDRIFLFFILLFIIYCLLTIFWSPQKDIALQQSVRVMEGLLLFVMLILGPWKFKNLVPWFIGGAVISSIIGIGQFLTQSTFSSTLFGMSMYMSDVSGVSVVASDMVGRWMRAYGTFVHPNILGGYTAIASVFWLLHNGMGNGERGMKKILDVIVLFILSLGLLFSFSRSALLSYFLFLISYFLYSAYRKLRLAKYNIAIATTFLTIMSIIVWPLLSVRLGVTSVYEVRSVVERSELVHGALDIVQDQLWVGGGIGNYVFSLYRFDPTLSGWAYQPVHNIFLLLLVEVGIVGLVLIVFSILAFLWWLYGVIGKERYLWFFVLMGVLVYSIIGFFDHYLVSLYSGIMLSGVLFGLVVLYIRDILHR